MLKYFQWDCFCFAICLLWENLLFVKWTILFKEDFGCTVQCDLRECIVYISLQKQPMMHVWGSGCGRAVSQGFTSNHRGKNSSSCPRSAGADGCRTERLAVSSKGLYCHVISRILFHVDVHTHQNTHHWKRLAASYFPIQLWCRKHISLSSASFLAFSIMSFLNGYGL